MGHNICKVLENLAICKEIFGLFFRKQKVIPTKVTYGQAQQCSCHSTAVKIEKCPVTDFRGKLHFFCQSEKNQSFREKKSTSYKLVTAGPKFRVVVVTDISREWTPPCFLSEDPLSVYFGFKPISTSESHVQIYLKPNRRPGV